MSDRWQQRGADEYVAGFNNLLPTGEAWSRSTDSVQQQTIAGLMKIWGDPVEVLAAILLTRESDPRATVMLLTDWERAWGLPDKCLAEPLTVDDRQKSLVSKMTLLGGQSREFFIALAAAIGYTITIREYSPFMAGISRCGNTKDLDDGTHYRWEVGSPDMRFYWNIRVGAVRLTWFRASAGQAGVDHLLTFAQATDLECLIRRYKPSHTEVTFDYSGL